MATRILCDPSFLPISLVPSEQKEVPKGAGEGPMLVARLQGHMQTTRGELRPVDGHFLTLPFSQGPHLIIVKVGVAPNTRARGEGMSQQSILAIKGISIPVLCNMLGVSF